MYVDWKVGQVEIRREFRPDLVLISQRDYVSSLSTTCGWQVGETFQQENLEARCAASVEPARFTVGGVTLVVGAADRASSSWGRKRLSLCRTSKTNHRKSGARRATRGHGTVHGFQWSHRQSHAVDGTMDTSRQKVTNPKHNQLVWF